MLSGTQNDDACASKQVHCDIIMNSIKRYMCVDKINSRNELPLAVKSRTEDNSVSICDGLFPDAPLLNIYL